jgi:hypothetical protein
MRKIKKVAGALILVGALAACSNDPSAPEADVPPGPDSQSASTESECQLIGFNHEELTPGCWAIQVRGLTDSPLAELDLPAGFSGNDAWVWRNADEDEWGAITLMRVGAVYRDACARGDKPVNVGPTVVDFAAALGAQQSTVVTKPVPVTLDGHDGVYLELTAPSDVNLSKCRGEELISWRSQRGEEGGAAPGYVSRCWVLDVAGQRVVLAANTMAVATEATVSTFTAIVEGATFDAG